MTKKLSDEKFQELVIKQFDTINDRFDTINDRFDTINDRAEDDDKFHELVIKQFETINERLSSIDDDVGHIKKDLHKVQETLTPLARAVDHDAETLVNHQRRITRIEKRIAA